MRKVVSSSPSAEASLDALESTVNVLLLQTGSILSDPANLDNRRLLRTSTTVKQHIPPAVERVQLALANLERELGVAKVILLRDLEEQRAIRNKTESPVIPRKATEQTQASGNENNATSDRAANVESAGNSDSKPMEIDFLQASPNNRQEPGLKGGSEEHHVTTHSDSDSSMDMNDAEVGSRAESGTKLVDNSGPKNIPDDDVDSVFGPDEVNPVNNGLNIDFGEGGASNLQSAMQSSNTVQEQPRNPDFADTSVGSLLPGLEVYANDDGQDAFGDVPDMDHLSAPTAVAGNGDNNGSMNTTEQEEFNVTGLGDGSTFDDLFDFGDFGGTDGNGANGGHATFDDSQFSADFFNI